MWIRALIAGFVLLTASVAMAATVKTLMKAAACPNAGDFASYYAIEGNGHDTMLANLPSQCQKLDVGTNLTIAVAGSLGPDVITVGQTKHPFLSGEFSKQPECQIVDTGANGLKTYATLTGHTPSTRVCLFFISKIIKLPVPIISDRETRCICQVQCTVLELDVVTLICGIIGSRLHKAFAEHNHRITHGFVVFYYG